MKTKKKGKTGASNKRETTALVSALYASAAEGHAKSVSELVPLIRGGDALIRVAVSNLGRALADGRISQKQFEGAVGEFVGAQTEFAIAAISHALAAGKAVTDLSKTRDRLSKMFQSMNGGQTNTAKGTRRPRRSMRILDQTYAMMEKHSPPLEGREREEFRLYLRSVMPTQEQWPWLDRKSGKNKMPPNSTLADFWRRRGIPKSATER